jgi:hypothetical protein
MNDDPVQEVKEVGRDSLLGIFVKIAHELGVETMITLAVPGGVVSGILISQDAWLTELTQLGDQAAAAIAQGLQSALEEHDLHHSSEESIPQGFLHLRDAHYVTGGGFLPTPPQGMLWRGCIADITGWSIGRLAQT